MAPPVWVWVDPDGTATGLDVEYDVRGLFAPPAQIVAEAVPGQPGERFREARHGTREFALPLYIRDEQPAVLVTKLRALVRAMDPTRGEGTLRLTGEPGDTREIRCRAVAGLDLNQTRGREAMPTHQRAAVVFRALDPYWYATADVSQTFTVGVVAPFFPILPLRLSSSEVFVDATVDNVGDLETWPVWRIVGPGSVIRLRDLSTGALTSLTSTALGSLTLGVGEEVEIDTRPGRKTVTRTSDGENLWPYVSGDSALWPLRVGSTAVRVEMSGATDQSSVWLSRRPRYLTP